MVVCLSSSRQDLYLVSTNELTAAHLEFYIKNGDDRSRPQDLQIDRNCNFY